MTTFCNTKYKCGLCGHKFTSQAIMSTNTFGSPDLDLRPPEMQRSTMRMWIAQCPKCGYVHFKIEKNGKKHKSYVKSDDYKTCEGANLLSELASNFYKCALILLRDDNKKEAYDAFLYAAWACDDHGDEEGSVLCRNKAIALYEDNLFKENNNLVLRHIDLLRRVGSFRDAIEFCESVQFEDELMKKIAKFQRELSLKEDMGCYRVIDSESIL